MNLLLLLRSKANPKSLCNQGHGLFSIVLRSVCFSTSSLTTTSSSTSVTNDSFYGRIAEAGRNPKASVVPVIEKWLEEGRTIKQSDLQVSIKKLNKQRCFSQALQISQWMSEQRQRGYAQFLGDYEVRLDLISKVHGLEEAEKYYHSIPNKVRTRLYDALLKCYVDGKDLEKAEALMQKMRDLGFAQTLSYNMMLSLYSQMEKREEQHILMLDMEDKGISCDRFTFKILLNAYAASSNIEQMEKILKKGRDPSIVIDWKDCVAAAKGYLKAGLIQKALTMLKQSEQLVKNTSRRFAHETLLPLYANIGKKEDVYRIWNLYKNTGGFYNSGYLCMITTLMKLDDLDGAERVWKDWASGMKIFDVRIPNVMIIGYSKKGLWQKAEAFVNEIAGSGMELDANSWKRLATGYCNGGEMLKAAEAVKKAISISKPGWMPDVHLLVTCLEGLKGQGDVEVADELLKFVGERCRFSPAMFDILKNLIENGNPSTSALDQVEDDDLSLNGEKPEVMDVKEEDSTEL